MNIWWVKSRSTKKNKKNTTQAYLRWYENRKPITKKLEGMVKFTGRLTPQQSKWNKKVDLDVADILKLTNLAENYNVSELVDCCLSKNKKRTINILNENNYNIDDCVLIIRTFLIKSKRLVRLCSELEGTKNIDEVITTCKPPIFWKEKEIVKQQVKSWSYKEAKNLMYQVNGIELLIKKHSNNSVNILLDFIMEKSTPINN